MDTPALNRQYKKNLFVKKLIFNGLAHYMVVRPWELDGLPPLLLNRKVLMDNLDFRFG